MDSSNGIQFTLSFKPILDGLNQFANALNQRLTQVQQFNEKIRAGEAAWQQMMGLVGGALGVAALMKYAAEAKEADNAQRQLITTLQRTGQIGAKEELNAQADALARVTNNSVETTTSVQRLLISFGLTAKQAEQLTENVLDFAQQTGMSAESAAMLMGRTLSGNQEELGRYRIQLDQTKGKVDALSDALRKFAGGSARASVANPQVREMAARYDEATKQLGRAVNALVGPFRQIMIPLIEKAAAAATELAAKLGPIAPMLADMLTAIIPLVAGVSAFSTAIKVLLMVLQPLRELIVFISGQSLLELSKSMAASAAEGTLLTQSFTTLSGALRLAGAAFGILGAAIAGFTLGKLVGELDVDGVKLKNWVSGTLLQIVANGISAWGKVKEFFSEISSGLAAIAITLELGVKVALNPTRFKEAWADYKTQIAMLAAQAAGDLAKIRAETEAKVKEYSNMAADVVNDGRSTKVPPKPTAPVVTSTGPGPDLNDQTFGKNAEAELKEQRAILDADYEQRNIGLQEYLDKRTDLFSKALDLHKDFTKAERDLAWTQEIVEQGKIRRQEEDFQQAKKEYALAHDIGEIQRQIATIEADRYTTTEQKNQQILPLLEQENQKLSDRIKLIDELAQKEPDSNKRLKLLQARDQLAGQQSDVQTKITEATPQTFGQGLQQGVGGKGGFLESLGTAAQDAAQSINGTLNSALQGTAGLIENLWTRTKSWGDAWRGMLVSVGQQFSQMVAQMIAKLIMRFAIERSLTALGILFHITGEKTKTAATLTGSGIRIATTIKEALASVYHGAVSAFEALASIPYVGPFLAAAAMAAALAGGIALVSKIGHADGGIISGPGGPRDDRIPAMLSNGEGVLRASSVSKFGPTFFNRLNAGVLDLAALPNNVVQGLAIPMQAGAGAAGLSGAAVASTTPRQPNITVVNVQGDREATRIARRGRAAGDVVQIVRDNWGAITKRGPI